MYQGFYIHETSTLHGWFTQESAPNNQWSTEDVPLAQVLLYLQAGGFTDCSKFAVIGFAAAGLRNLIYYARLYIYSILSNLILF